MYDIAEQQDGWMVSVLKTTLVDDLFERPLEDSPVVQRGWEVDLVQLGWD